MAILLFTGWGEGAWRDTGEERLRISQYHCEGCTQRLLYNILLTCFFGVPFHTSWGFQKLSVSPTRSGEFCVLCIWMIKVGTRKKEGVRLASGFKLGFSVCELPCQLLSLLSVSVTWYLKQLHLERSSPGEPLHSAPKQSPRLKLKKQPFRGGKGYCPVPRFPPNGGGKMPSSLPLWDEHCTSAWALLIKAQSVNGLGIIGFRPWTET